MHNLDHRYKADAFYMRMYLKILLLSSLFLAGATSAFPIDIALLVDVSEGAAAADTESMAPWAIERFIQLLDKDSSLAVIGYSDIARTLVPLSPLKDVSPKKIRTMLEEMYSNSEWSHPAQGLQAAVASLEKGTSDYKSIIMVNPSQINTSGGTGDAFKMKTHIRHNLFEEMEKERITLNAVVIGTNMFHGVIKRGTLESGGMYIEVSNSYKLPSGLIRLLPAVSNKQVITGVRDTFSIPKHTSRFALIADLRTIFSEIQMTDPEGHTISTDTNESHPQLVTHKKKKISFFELAKPLPGEWSVAPHFDGHTDCLVFSCPTLRLEGLNDIYLTGEHIPVRARVNPPEYFETISMMSDIQSMKLLITSSLDNDTLPLYDDGNHNDLQLDDSIFGNVLSQTTFPGKYRIIAQAETQHDKWQKEMSITVTDKWAEVNVQVDTISEGDPLVITAALNLSPSDVRSITFETTVETPEGDAATFLLNPFDDNLFTGAFYSTSQEGEYHVTVKGAGELVCGSRFNATFDRTCRVASNNTTQNTGFSLEEITPFQKNSNTSRFSSFSKILFGVIGGILIFAAAVISFLFINHKKSEDAKESTRKSDEEDLPDEETKALPEQNRANATEDDFKPSQEKISLEKLEAMDVAVEEKKEEKSITAEKKEDESHPKESETAESENKSNAETEKNESSSSEGTPSDENVLSSQEEPAALPELRPEEEIPSEAAPNVK